MNKVKSVLATVVVCLLIPNLLVACQSEIEPSPPPVVFTPTPTFAKSTQPQTNPPLDIDLYRQPLSIGAYNYFAITDPDCLISWGDNQFGTVGNDDTTLESPNFLLQDAVSVSAGQYQTLAVDHKGVLWAIGDDVARPLDGGHNLQGMSKVMDHIIMAATGNHHTVALKEDGSVWTWGFNYQGQLGNGSVDEDNSTLNIHKPEKILEGAVYVATSGDDGYALMRDGRVLAWGSGTAVRQVDREAVISTPTEVFADATFICPVFDSLFVIKADKTLWSLGYFPIGDLSEDEYIEPTQILDDVVFCSDGIAIQSNGTSWAWDVKAFNPAAADENEHKHFLHKISDNAIYAEQDGVYMLVISSVGKLLRIGDGKDLWKRHIEEYTSIQIMQQFTFAH